MLNGLTHPWDQPWLFPDAMCTQSHRDWESAHAPQISFHSSLMSIFRTLPGLEIWASSITPGHWAAPFGSVVWEKAFLVQQTFLGPPDASGELAYGKRY